MYNEEAGAQECLATIAPYLVRLPGISTILVVEDGSKDTTQKVVEDFISSRQNTGVKMIVHERNQGYGAALRTGIKYVIENGYDYAVFMDSDLTNHPRDLPQFYEKMQEGYDYIKATRYSKGGKAEGVPWRRRVVSWVGNMLARPAFRIPIHDFTNGFRAVKISVLAQMELTERGFPIIVEELWQAKKYARTFCEVPYVLTSRAGARGKTSFYYGWPTYKAYLKYVWKAFCTRSR
ncbi:hypothetical protein A3B21_00130 [Candidatus Uhrbacteria bacterium RIFCSPLOWO2_01_FULL_47_24]|uniref:Glycosyltransferase 2-like domain-containing protein n=1 Tax=Candidatus Uhrbacteria bacterium RIFCSPLOWO2_01_FULL_47_24 TaxID=1802401 RepID=A0A1F7USU0_9BACT|nr:MAG: hypothetical protein A3D58_01505 [Candidatus Uhrbacteria bacterium RIFCSPHIGHO2_02_FULL_46_47]OGL75416.1 MAG: hypothetical protein A3F52_04845 [Candidatus Uhrbacteria bacterium RIFCSPHIGHO2_12_FULL_47_11]OGL81319.1 MAG: hypothetical protein A3B21_00130 [Candidatus Uhrbacteria bacterium RIFCSPLOWO2_01_FULL_47_24]